jgi:hypothetical protein
MKKSILLYSIIFISIIGLLSTISCKRSAQQDPEMGGPAGFRIILSGTANPSTLYVPKSEPAVSSLITVTALNNDGTPARYKNVVFQADLYGYFENFQITDVKNTGESGVATITYFIPPATCVRGTAYTEIKATLVDDGRLDSMQAEIIDYIPIKIIYHTDLANIIIHGNVWTTSGEGLGEVPIELESTNAMENGVAVTRPSGSYEFYVTRGWTGTITPNLEEFDFTPESYTFDSPLYADVYGVDFIARFTGTDALAVDVTEWVVSAIGGTQIVNVYNVSGNFSISYLVLPDRNWIHVSPSSGNTPGSFTITVDENTTADDRNGTVTVTATDGGSQVTIDITQSSYEVSSEATLSVDRTTLNIDEAGSTETVNVFNSTSDDDIDFIVTTNDNWITIDPTSGTTDTTINITIEQNTGAARTGTVTITATSTGVLNPTVTITVIQEAGASLAVDVTSRNVLAAGETFIVNVRNPTTSESLYYELTNPDPWITASPLAGTTPGQFSITVNANGTGLPRNGVLTVTAPSNGATATVTINQDG